MKSINFEFLRDGWADLSSLGGWYLPEARHPQYGGKFCHVIDNYDPRAEQLIDDFKQPDNELTIAISVDMLDTGIEVWDWERLEQAAGPIALVRSELDKLIYIGPLREVPSRHPTYRRSPDISRWARGAAAWDVLHNADEKFMKRSMIG